MKEADIFMKTIPRKKKSLFLLMFVMIALTVIFVGCKSEQTMEGMIAKIKDQQILIVEGITMEEIQDSSEEEILEKAENATYFEVKEIGNLEVGQQVKVWVENLDSSNPSSGSSDKVEILN